jgi:hypothetical protein
VNNLDGDLSVESCVFAFIDGRHSTSSDNLQNLVSGGKGLSLQIAHESAQLETQSALSVAAGGLGKVIFP